MKKFTINELDALFDAVEQWEQYMDIRGQVLHINNIFPEGCKSNCEECPIIEECKSLKSEAAEKAIRKKIEEVRIIEKEKKEVGTMLKAKIITMKKEMLKCEIKNITKPKQVTNHN